MAEDSSPIAGWYPDPENPALERWWNGVAWSDQRRPSTVPAAAPLPSAPAEYAAPVAVAPATASAAQPAAEQQAQQYPAQSYPVQPYAGQSYSAQPYATPQSSVLPYAAPHGGGGYPGYAPIPAPPQNGMALAGIITSGVGALLNWTFLGLPGLVGGVLSILGLRRARELAAMGMTETRRGLAIAGIAIGFGGSGLTILLFVVWVVAAIASGW